MKFGALIAAAACVAVTGWMVQGASAQQTACEPGDWLEVQPAFFQRAGCIEATGNPVRFQAIAFDLTKTDLGLRGSRPDGYLPTLDDVTAAESSEAKANYSLEKAFQDGDLAIANVGSPEDEKFFVASGLVRIAGKNVSERDTTASFKSAMFCLNEAEFNTIGSRFIVFNAFENHRPIELNDRLRQTNCLDVVQVGPRIVEYRAKKGILPAEIRTKSQRYSVFAQGNGGSIKSTGFYGYIFVFEDPINLYNIQEFLLSPGAGHLDRKMRVGMVLATDEYSGMLWRSKEGGTKQAGAGSRPHPVFLTIKAAAVD